MKKNLIVSKGSQAIQAVFRRVRRNKMNFIWSKWTPWWVNLEALTHSITFAAVIYALHGLSGSHKVSIKIKSESRFSRQDAGLRAELSRISGAPPAQWPTVRLIHFSNTPPPLTSLGASTLPFLSFARNTANRPQSTAVTSQDSHLWRSLGGLRGQETENYH